MSTTTTKSRSLALVLNESNPNEIASALQKLALGTLLTPLKRTFTGLTGAATYDLTAIDGTGEIVGTANPNRLPALAITSLRVTAATTATVVGAYGTTDIGGNVVSPATHTIMGVALLSDDGKSLTFASADVTAFVIEYIPRTMSTTQAAADFAPNS